MNSSSHCLDIPSRNTALSLRTLLLQPHPLSGTHNLASESPPPDDPHTRLLGKMLAQLVGMPGYIVKCSSAPVSRSDDNTLASRLSEMS